MNEEQKLAMKSMILAQAFVDTLDQFKGTNSYRQQIKLRGNGFIKEVDKFLDTAYCGGETDSNVLALIEECQVAIDKVFDEQVKITE